MDNNFLGSCCPPPLLSSFFLPKNRCCLKVCCPIWLKNGVVVLKSCFYLKFGQNFWKIVISSRLRTSWLDQLYRIIGTFLAMKVRCIFLWKPLDKNSKSLQAGFLKCKISPLFLCHIFTLACKFKNVTLSKKTRNEKHMTNFPIIFRGFVWNLLYRYYCRQTIVSVFPIKSVLIYSS